jgi:hypothetical protein
MPFLREFPGLYTGQPTNPDRQTVQIQMSHLWPKISPLIDDDKDVPTAHQLPIAVLPVPVTISVGVPVSVIPIGIGVDRRAIVRMDDSPVGIAGMICTIGAANGRATASVNGSAITGLDCCAIAVVSYFSVFPLIGIRVEGGGRNGEKN